MPYVGRNLNILTSKELMYILRSSCILCENVDASLLYKSSPNKCKGVPTNWTSKGEII